MLAPSLELNWLPLSHRKAMPTPRIVFWDADDCAGCLYRRTNERAQIHEFGMDLKDGDVILLSTHWGAPTSSTIAHEYRHLQQHYLPSLPRIGTVQQFSQRDDTIEEWEKSIKQFYSKQPWEVDALRYQLKFPDETSKRVAELLNLRT